MNRKLPLGDRVLTTTVALLVACATSLWASAAQTSGKAELIAGEVMRLTIFSVSSSVTTVDGKPGPPKLTINAELEVKEDSGIVKSVRWGNDPETKVIDAAGKPGKVGDIKKEMKVEVTAVGSGTSLVAREVRILAEKKPD